MKFNRFFFFVILTVFIWSCKKDDNGPSIEPPKPLSEIVNKDNDSIIKYLETHFYNYEEFNTPPADFDYKIVLGKIEGDNADKTPLSEMMESKTVKVRSRDIGLNNDEEVEHTYYYLVARQGTGVFPTVADSTYATYEGSLLNDVKFGSSITPLWFAFSNGTRRGFIEMMQYLKSGGDVEIKDDGTYEIKDYGVGLVIFPSALGYYSEQQGSIPAYSPLIFKIDLMAVNETDHDNDGVPTYREDLNGNGFFDDDNTDKKSEEDIRTTLVPNFLDNDDDNDGKLTIDEIKVDGVITFPYPDTDKDGLPDYLDSDN